MIVKAFRGKGGSGRRQKNFLTSAPKTRITLKTLIFPAHLTIAPSRRISRSVGTQTSDQPRRCSERRVGVDTASQLSHLAANDPELQDQTMDDAALDEAKTAQAAFIAKGTARVAPVLNDLNTLADRLGGQSGMVLHALHGVMVGYTAALLNHIAGVEDPAEGVEPRDETSDVVDGEPAPHMTPETLDVEPTAPLADPEPAAQTADQNTADLLG